MKLEKELRIFAGFMGWNYASGLVGTHPHRFQGKVTIGPNFDAPTERKWWSEIWDKMDFEFYVKYDKNLTRILFIAVTDGFLEYNRAMHTAKPEVCWSALIKTLK